MNFDPPNAINGTIFGEAWRAGAVEGSPDGPFVYWYPDLEITHILKSTGYETYTDRPGPRIPRHLLIYGPSGWFKSSSTKRFLSKAIGTEEPADTAERGRRPIMFMLEGSSSYESLRGSSDSEGHLVRPFFACIDYLYCSELFAFLGADTGRQQDLVDKVGRVLEERDMRVRLIKLQNLNIQEVDQEWLHRYNVEYNPREGTLSYEARCVMIACSHFFDEDEKKVVENRGFDDRFFYSTWRGTYEQMTAISDHGGWKSWASEDEMDLLREFNSVLERVEFASMPAPPEEMIRHLHDQIREDLEEVVLDGRVNPVLVLSGRDWLVCYQLLTAAAIERTVREMDLTSIGETVTVPTIEYKPEDVEVAEFFVNRYVWNRFHEMREHVMQDDDEWQNAHRLKAIVTELGDSDIQSNDILDFCIKNFHTDIGTVMSRSSAYRLINDWMDRRWITRERRGVYSLTARGSAALEMLNHVSVSQNRRPNAFGGGTRSL